MQKILLVPVETLTEVHEGEAPQAEMGVDPEASERLEKKMPEVFRQVPAEHDGLVDAVEFGGQRDLRRYATERSSLEEMLGSVDSMTTKVVQARIAGYEDSFLMPRPVERLHSLGFPPVFLRASAPTERPVPLAPAEDVNVQDARRGSIGIGSRMHSDGRLRTRP